MTKAVKTPKRFFAKLCGVYERQTDGREPLSIAHTSIFSLSRTKREGGAYNKRWAKRIADALNAAEKP